MITVVSGLPRSGTSLLMQMLSAGGMEILSDGQRTADENNPRGYLEYEKVKSLNTDRSWLQDADGKAVKIITQLLPNLPRKYRYAVLYLVRPIEEVLKSQSAMLEKLGKKGSELPAAALTAAYAKQVERIQAWFTRNPTIKTRYVMYQEVLSDPERQARVLKDFLGADLDVAAMAAAVDTSLWRQRA